MLIIVFFKSNLTDSLKMPFRSRQRLLTANFFYHVMTKVVFSDMYGFIFNEITFPQIENEYECIFVDCYLLLFFHSGIHNECEKVCTSFSFSSSF